MSSLQPPGVFPTPLDSMVAAASAKNLSKKKTPATKGGSAPSAKVAEVQASGARLRLKECCG